VGTSTSFRAPPVPRWQAFTTALQLGVPLERVRSEMFNAGDEWQAALARPALAELAVAAQTAGEVLRERVGAGAALDEALRGYAAESRARAEAAGASEALALGERALRAWLVRASSAESVATQDPAVAVERVRSAGPETAVAGYLGELLGQYARHVTAREIGRLTESEGGSVRQAREVTRKLASLAAGVGAESTGLAADAATLRDQWARLVADAFARGRRLPEREGG
jgi:hypothetical protein